MVLLSYGSQDIYIFVALFLFYNHCKKFHMEICDKGHNVHNVKRLMNSNVWLQFYIIQKDL